MCGDCCYVGDCHACVDGMRGDGGVMDVLETESYGDDDAARRSSQLEVQMDGSGICDLQ